VSAVEGDFGQANGQAVATLIHIFGVAEVQGPSPRSTRST
jgi:hypothetical protein